MSLNPASRHFNISTGATLINSGASLLAPSASVASINNNPSAVLS